MQKIPSLFRSYLIEPWLPQTPDISNYQRHRNRFVVCVLWGTLLYIAAVVLISQLGFNIEIESRQLLTVFSLTAILGIVSALFTLRFTGRQILALNLFITTLSLGLLYIVLNTGGIYSPMAPCAIIMPALATLSISARAGIIWSFIIFAFSTAFYIAAKAGIAFTNVIAQETAILAEFVGIFTATTFIIFITVYYDISTRRLRALFETEHSKFIHLAHHDSLTGLANRRHFINEIERAIFDASINNTSFCVLYFDLNEFKNINDTLGHHYGDMILMEFAKRLRAQSRASDIIARLGGDEFSMLLPGLGDSEVIKTKILSYSEALAKPLTLEDITYQISASIGYAIYPKHGKDCESLLKVADHKMYSVKRSNNSSAAYSKQPS
jgi:diguanylate cyclase (GGDEF)-like protein